MKAEERKTETEREICTPYLKWLYTAEEKAAGIRNHTQTLNKQRTAAFYHTFFFLLFFPILFTEFGVHYSKVHYYY